MGTLKVLFSVLDSRIPQSTHKSTPSAQFYRMSPTNPRSFKYTLRSSSGAERYIRIDRFPKPKQDGIAEFKCMDGICYQVRFQFNLELCQFDAWFAKAPAIRFTIKPLTDVNDVIYKLEVEFEFTEGVAHFTWDSYTPPVEDTKSPIIDITELLNVEL